MMERAEETRKKQRQMTLDNEEAVQEHKRENSADKVSDTTPTQNNQGTKNT
jgi:hypothetical protein